VGQLVLYRFLFASIGFAPVTWRACDAQRRASLATSDGSGTLPPPNASLSSGESVSWWPERDVGARGAQFWNKYFEAAGTHVSPDNYRNMISDLLSVTFRRRTRDDRFDDNVTNDRSNCVLLFSGGRDSAIAATRLARTFSKLTLVTVTSEHLIGIEAVHERLRELRRLVPVAEWLHVAQPRLNGNRDHEHDHQTCLPCHLAYAAVGAAVTRRGASSDLAFGYVRYQADWPEQTPEAVDLLRHELGLTDRTLHLPVYDLDKKADAVAELARLGLTETALEQKCQLQKFHINLGRKQLRRRLQQWAVEMRAVLKDPPPLRIIEERTW